MKTQFSVTKTVAHFLRSQAFVKILMGPRREGKTTGAYLDWLKRTYLIPPEFLPYRVIVVRDTWTNLLRTTIDSLDQLAAKGLEVDYRENRTEALVGGGRVHFFFLGMDTVKDLNKFQGFGAAGLWIEEPAAAAANDIGAGLPPEVFGIGITSLSQPGVPHGVLITENPPDEEHWSLSLEEALRQVKASDARLAGLDMGVETFNIPPGENPWISDADRLRNRAGLEMIGRGDLVSRLVEGQPGFVVLGETATPEYSDREHVAPVPLRPIQGVPILRSYDYGLTPVCIWWQATPSGFIHILDAVQEENAGIEQLIEIKVKPWEKYYLGNPSAWRFRDTGGHEATEREQTNSERSALHSMTTLLGTVAYEPGPIEWGERIGAIKRLLNAGHRGRRILQVDPQCRLVRRCLKGGAHYPRDANGKPIRTKDALKKASGLHGHVLDALMHGAALLFPLSSQFQRPPRKRPPINRDQLAWQGR